MLVVEPFRWLKEFLKRHDGYSKFLANEELAVESVGGMNKLPHCGQVHQPPCREMKYRERVVGAEQ